MPFLLLLACQPENPSDSAEPAVQPADMRETYPETDADLLLEPADIVVEPYTDQQVCWFTTYTGPDVGIYDGVFRQSQAFGHHVIVMRTNADEDDFPDGTAMDCEDGEMTDMEPFVLPSEVEAVGLTYLELPGGMANKLKSGERLLVQSHHINTTGEPVLVNDRIELFTMPVDEVETFVAPLAHTSTNLAVQPGEHTRQVTCEFEDDHNFLYVLGHMHEWGASFSIDYNKEDGSTERIYEIADWDILYRDLPPITRYADGEFQVKAGESFTTTCTWLNDTEEVLGFPEEMCVTTAMVYPATVALVCDED